MLPLMFRCPLCGEPFQVAVTDQGQAVACPHCERAIAIPASTTSTTQIGTEKAPLEHSHPTDFDASNGTRPPSAPSHFPKTADREPPPRLAGVVAQQDVGQERPASVRQSTRKVIQLAGEAYEVRSLTPEERAAFRRRVNLIVFLASIVLLAVVVLGLLWWRG